MHWIKSQPPESLRAVIDVWSGWMSTKTSMWLATKSLLILSTNYHQNINHQSLLSIIDCFHCHHWLYAIGVIHPSHIYSMISLSIVHQFVMLAHTHTGYTNKDVQICSQLHTWQTVRCIAKVVADRTNMLFVTMSPRAITVSLSSLPEVYLRPLSYNSVIHVYYSACICTTYN